MQIARVVRSYRLDSQAEFVLGPYVTSLRVKKKLSALRGIFLSVILLNVGGSGFHNMVIHRPIGHHPVDSGHLSPWQG